MHFQKYRFYGVWITAQQKTFLKIILILVDIKI